MLIESRTEGAPTVVLDVPSDFHQVPMEPDTRSRTEAQLDLVADLGLRDAAQREAVSLYLEALAGRLRAGQASNAVSGAAFCAVELDGRPSTATLSVAIQHTGTDDSGLAVLGAAEAMRRSDRYDTTDVVSIAGRPAVRAVAQRSRTETSSGPGPDTVREVSMLVPIPGHRHAAMITLSTPSLEHWTTYLRLVDQICASVRLARSPEQAVTIDS